MQRFDFFSIAPVISRQSCKLAATYSKNTGHGVAAKMYLRCLWGATENGIVPQELSPEIYLSHPSGRSLWSCVRFHSCVGVVFDEVTDGVYELIIRRDQAATMCYVENRPDP